MYIVIAKRKKEKPFVKIFADEVTATDYKEYIVKNNNIYKYDSVKVALVDIVEYID